MDFKNPSSISPPPLLESNIKTSQNRYTHSCNLLLEDSTSSITTNNYGSHAPGIRKAMKMLEAQFSHSNASSSPSAYNNIYNTTHMSFFGDAYHPNLLVTRSSQSHEAQFNKIVVAPAEHVASVKVHFKKKNIDDGRIHSLPHKKYGPYTCPKCYSVLATSQKFASHVTSNHYKFDSPEEREKRRISRISKKSDLQIHKQITCVPVVPSTYEPHIASLVNNGDQNQTQSPLALPLNGV